MNVTVFYSLLDSQTRTDASESEGFFSIVGGFTFAPFFENLSKFKSQPTIDHEDFVMAIMETLLLVRVEEQANKPLSIMLRRLSIVTLLSFLFLDSTWLGVPPLIVHSSSWLSLCSAFVLIPSPSTRIATTATRRRTPPPSPLFLSSSSNNNSDSDTTSTSTSTTTTSSSSSSKNNSIPANLRRKVRAPRPSRGHVVGKNGIRITPSQQSSSTGGSAENPLPLYKQGRSKKNRQAHHHRHRLLQIVAGSAKGRKLESPSVHLRPMMAKVREAVFSTLTSFGLYDTTTSATARRKQYKKKKKSNNSITTTATTASSSSTLRHLDLFAGSGSVGLESLSRGASHCTFVDLAPDCCDTIRRNAVHCQFIIDDDNDDSSSSSNHRVTVLCADVMKVLQQQTEQQQQSASASTAAATTTALPYDLVTICPPYEEVVYADLLEAVVSSPLVTEDTVVLVEYPTELGSLPHVISSSSSAAPPLPTLSSSDSSATETSSTSSTLALPRRTMIGVRNRRYGRTVIAMYVVNPSGGASTGLSGSNRLDPDAACSRPEEFV